MGFLAVARREAVRPQREIPLSDDYKISNRYKVKLNMGFIAVGRHEAVRPHGDTLPVG